MIEKCSIGNMSYNLQNITLIILMLILIIVIIYYLKNSGAKHSEIIEKYTATNTNTAIDMSDTSSYQTHNSVATSVKNSLFPTAGTVVTLRDCQVKFNNDGTSKYEYKDGWQEIDTLKETPDSSPITITKKIISRTNETNKDDANAFVNYTEHSKCFKKMDGTTNTYKYQGNDLIQYDTDNHIELKVGADGVPENYMEMKFNLDNSQEKINNYYINITNSICSLKYSNNLGGGNSGTGLGNLQLYRLTLDADNIITAVNQITINNTNNHIFTVSPTTNLADLLTSSTRRISYYYDYSNGNFRYRSLLNSGTQDNGTNNINVDIYTFNRELLCNKSQGGTTYQTIKSYKITNDKQIDVNKIVSATSGDIDVAIPSTNFPGAASSYESKDQVLRAIENNIISDIASANTTTNQKIDTAIENIGTKTSDRDTFLENINTKAKFFNKIFDTSTSATTGNFLVSQSGLISNLELNKLGYSTADITTSETILNTSEEPSFSIIKNNQPEDIYEIVEYKYNGSGNFTPYDKTFLVETICDILIIGGGGAGGQSAGGGGGAGGLIYLTKQKISAGSYNIFVGKGGNISSENGNNSSFGNFVAKGGGGGASMSSDLPGNGGSGGGGNRINWWDPSVAGQSGGSGTVNQGNAGGTGKNHSGANSAGGGGGGAGATGDSAFAFGRGANGGIGRAIDITGESIYYAGGGGGGSGSDFNTAGTGGLGGGGNGAVWSKSGSNGINGLGGGGGGGSAYPGTGRSGGSGGSGIVILRYKNVPQLIGNEKQITLKNIYNSITYDFTPYNTLNTWNNYAKSIGARFNFTHGFFDGYDGVFVATPTIGYFELTLPSTYNTITVSFTNGWNDTNDKTNLVNLKINGDIKATATASQTKTYTQLYTGGDILRIEEIHSYIRRDLQITLTYVPQYRVVLPINTKFNINNTDITLNAGTYDIIMGASNSQIINRDTNVLKGTYSNIDGTKLTFKYEIRRNLSQLHNLQTTFSAIQDNSLINNMKYSLGNKTNGIIKKYKIYIYKKYDINHNIIIYAGDRQLINGTDYVSSGDSESVPKIINLYTYYITIKKDISGDIYFKSDNHIYYIDETSRTTFNNTTDAQFSTNVNNLKASGTTKLTILNDIFDITTATANETTARGQLITYSINSSLYPQAPLSISYNNSTLGANDSTRTSLNTLRTTYNNIHNYSPSDAGALTSILNIHTFGDILTPVITDIGEYISYESPTQITPDNRTTTFNIYGNSTKYIYFKKR
jgi:hypothetical protein